jgi:hypothetical protein
MLKLADLELVEAKALVINDLVEQLVLLGIIGPNLITGQVVFQRPAITMTGEVIPSAGPERSQLLYL